jgi:hypothetical protein
VYLSIVCQEDDDINVITAIFTRDGTLPHLLDYISFDDSGEWSSCEVYDSTGLITSMNMDITSQNVTVLYGTMQINDDSEVGFCAVFSLFLNSSMNAGYLIDENGNVWIIMANRGLISMYASDYVDSEFRDVQVSLTKNTGDVVLPVSADIGGDWEGLQGYVYGSDDPVGISQYSMSIEQDSCRIYGSIGSDGDVTFEGIICISLPKTAEITINIEGELFHGQISISDSKITIMISDGDIDGLSVLEFKRVQ